MTKFGLRSQKEKNLSKRGIEENFAKLIKGICENATPNLTLSGETVCAFLKSETRQGARLSPTLIKPHIRRPSQCQRQDKATRRLQV